MLEDSVVMNLVSALDSQSGGRMFHLHPGVPSPAIAIDRFNGSPQLNSLIPLVNN